MYNITERVRCVRNLFLKYDYYTLLMLALLMSDPLVMDR